MMSWNNVSPTYHYLDDFRSDDDEGLVRVGFTRSEGSLQIFAVGVSIRRCSWLSYVVVTSTSSLDLLCDKIRFLQLSILVVKDCKSPLLGVFPANVFSVFARSHCKQQVVIVVFKALCGNGVCRCPLPLLPFHCMFKLRWTRNNRLKKTTRTLRYNFIFFMSFCVKLSFCTTKI